MFKCDYCGKSVEENIKPIHIIEEKRFKFYARHKSSGYEIVKEKNACQKCVDDGIAVEATDPISEPWHKKVLL